MKLIQLIFSLTAPGCNTAVSASRSNPAFVASRSWSRNMHQVGGVGQTTSLLAATSGEETENNDININNSSTSSSTSSSISSIKRGTKFNSPEINEYTRQQISKIFGSSRESEFVPLDFAGIWSRPKLVTDASSSDSDDTKKKNSGDGNIDVHIDIEAILLSSRDQCKDIAHIYKQYLTKSTKQDELLSEDDEDDHDHDDDASTSIAKALPIPLAPSTFTPAIKLLSQTYSCTPLSKSVLLSFNTLFLNRDNGLFDNLPWSTWSIDPTLTERDAANNVVQDKYTMGKRVAYQRFMGKDWQGRSLSLGNLANRIKYTLEGEEGNSSNRDEDDGNYGGGDVVDEDDDEDDMMVSLSQRLLQLEIKEAQMEIAKCEQRVAITSNQVQSSTTAVTADDDQEEEVNQLEQYRDALLSLDKARERLQLAESSFGELNTVMESISDEGRDSTAIFSFPWNNNNEKKNESKNKTRQRNKKTQTLLMSILDRLATQDNPPPYRGAIGFPAKLDTKEEVFEDSILPYTSPYDLLLEVIDEQLNSKVVGCVLEPTSLLEGNLVLGGAILLKRKGVAKSTTLAGEEVQYTDDDDDLGNEGVLPRSMYVVECFSDEAVGMAMAAKAPIFVEGEIFSRAGSVPVKLDVNKASEIKSEYGNGDGWVQDMESLSFATRVPQICPTDESSFVTQVEGEGVSSDKETNSVRIPMTTSPQLFGNNPTPQSSTTSRSSSVFSTFNPVKDLDEYDGLSDDAKVRLLLKLESFSGILPRPRAVRMSRTKSTDSESYDDASSLPPSALDDILIPLVDESVRRQYRIREAERRKDYEEADALRAEISPRQTALENAQRAREEGLDDEAQRLEEEAELYKLLRADITQDEGAYNRYLDRDDWYERETQARIKRLDKSKFGTLLDGIDLP